MKSNKLRRALLGLTFGGFFIIQFQNCGPAKLSMDGSSTENSVVGATTELIGTKVDLSSLLNSSQENPNNILFPTSSVINEYDLTEDTPIIENIILKKNDFTKIIWVHGPSSTVVATGEAFNQMTFSSDLAGLFYVFGYRNETTYLIKAFNITNKKTPSLNVNSAGAVQVSKNTVMSDALSEGILIEVKAPNVDLRLIQFVAESVGLNTMGKKAILVTKKFSESIDLQIHLSDKSGEASSLTLNLPARPMPAMSAVPSSFNFGDVVVDTESNVQILNIKNTGTASLTFTSDIVISSGFIGTGNCSPNNPLAPNESCTINLKFKPSSTGIQSGSLTINSDAPNSSQVVSLSGKGLPVPTPAVSLSSSSINFGDQFVGSKSATMYITLSNTGNANLDTSLAKTVTGDFALETSGTCGNSLAPGESCTIAASFTPTLTGARQGSLKITTNAPLSPHTVSLSGIAYKRPDPVISGENYKVISSCPTQNRVMAVSGGSLADQANLVLEDRNDSKASQTFKFQTSGSGFIITAQHSGKVLDIANAATYNAQVQQATFTGGNSQIFKLLTTSDGYYRLQNLNSGLYVDTTTSSGTGTPIYQKSESSECIQKFQLSPL